MIRQGADIIDIGAESTRPNALQVTDELELQRLTPIVSEIRKNFPDVWLSIDTSSPTVMEQMAGLGADLWNDVRGLKRDGAAQMASRLALPVVIMHSRGEPDTMNKMAVYDDVIAEVSAELSLMIDRAVQVGVRHDNIVIDVGMGFAKNFEQHVTIMQNLSQFSELGYPMLYGVSRKRFVGEILANTNLPHLQDNIPTMRDTAGVALAVLAVAQGASIIRTHAVSETVEGLAAWWAISEKPDDD